MPRPLVCSLATSLLLSSALTFAQGAEGEPPSPPAPAPVGSEPSASPPAEPQPESSGVSDSEEALGQAAEELFDEAREARLDEDYATCHAKAELAWHAEKHPKIAALLGDCALGVDKPLQALRHLEYFFQNRPAKVPQSFLDHAKGRLEAARGRLSRISVTTEPRGAKVRIDDAPVEVDGHTWVLPGRHRVEATFEGYAPTSQEATLVRGQKSDLKLVLIALAPEPAPDEAPPEGEPTSDLPLWPAFAAGAAGLIAVGVGAGLLAVAGSAEREADALLARERASAGHDSPCSGPAPPPSCAEIASRRDEEETFHNAGLGVVITGSVLVVGAAAYTVGTMVLGLDSGHFALATPWASPTGGGVAMKGAF